MGELEPGKITGRDPRLRHVARQAIGGLADSFAAV